MAGPTFVGAGKKVKLTVRTSGIDSGEAAELIVTKKADGSTLDTLQSKVKDDLISADWEAKGPGPDDPETQWDVVYKAKCKGLETQAQPLLVYCDTIEVESKDKDDASLPDATFLLSVSTEKRVRSTGSAGLRKETSLPPGKPAISWLKPFHLLEWIDEEGPKRSAKLEKVPPAVLLWPKKGTHSQLVNLEADDEAPEQGSKVKVKARLVGGKKGDTVYFTTTYPKTGNSARNDPAPGLTGAVTEEWCKGGGAEATLKDDDGTDEGYAEAEIELGLAGGDTVVVTASGCKDWVDESVTVTNWRRIFYQITKPKTLKLHDLADLTAALATVFIEYEEYKVVEIEEGDSGAPAGSWVDGADLGKPGTKLLCVGDHNRDYFRGKFEDEKAPLGVHLIFCHLQYDGGEAGAWHEGTLGLKLGFPTGRKTIAEPDDYDVFSLSMQEGTSLCRPGSTWTSAAPAGHPDHGKTGDVDPAWVKADPSRDRVVVELGGDPAAMVGEGTPPPGKKDTDAETKHPVKVLLNFLMAKGPFLGDSDGAHMLIVVPPNVKCFNRTVAHELAHAIRQCCAEVAPGLNVADHGRHYTDHDHFGDHCADGLADDVFGQASYLGLAAPCIMFGEGRADIDPPGGQVAFCARCIPFVKADHCQSLDGADTAKQVMTKDAAEADAPPDPTYRLTLSMGDPNLLCDPDTTDLGRQQRAWAAGTFYVRAGASRFADRWRDNWAHWKRVVSEPAADDAAAATELTNLLKKELVSVVGREAEELALPAPGELARLRLPGGYTMTNYSSAGFPSGHRHRYLEDQAYFNEHRVGAVPIKVKVELQSEDGAWGPAPADVQVHLQLLTPDAVPAGNAASAPALRADTRVNQGTHPAPHGPERYVTRQVADVPPVADDPQVDNCPASRGGKRAPAATGATYFDTAARPGWNDGAAPFAVPTDSTHRLAVKAVTNAQGEAGFIFRPSCQGGDRFKLRAFIDPIGARASDGTDSGAARAETGTFVVWRTLRVSKYLVFDYPSGATAGDRAVCGGALGTIDFEALKQEFGRCYVDLVVERTAARQVHHIGDATWASTIRAVRGSMSTQPANVSVAYDLATLFPDATTVPGLVPLRTTSEYDANKPAASPAGTDLDILFMHFEFIQNLLRHFTKRSSTSGLAIIQAPMGDSLTFRRHNGDAAAIAFYAGSTDMSTSGVALDGRGCFLFYGRDKYGTGMPYDLNRNTLHEVGHALFMPHQWTDRDATTGAVSGGVPAEHDYSDYCIMSYQRGTRNHFDYCGRCNLKLRGWDTSTIPKNNNWRAGT